MTIVHITEDTDKEVFRHWLLVQMEQWECYPSNGKITFVPEAEKLARTSVAGTKFSELLSTLDNVQGCEYPVAVVFFADESNKSFSNLLEMCSRAQYKLFLVIENNFQLVQGEASELSKFLTNEEMQKFNMSHPLAPPQQVLPNLNKFTKLKARLGWRDHQCQRVIDRPDLGSQLLLHPM